MPGDYSDDATLVAALRERDEAAFVWLLDRYDAPLRRVALTFVSNRSVADEVVQDTWLGVIRGIATFEGRSTVKTWVFRMMMNISRTRGERERRTVPFSAGETRDDDVPSFALDRFRGQSDSYPRHWARPPEPWDEQPHERLQSRETLDRVLQAIERLPLNQRTVIRLRDIDGWTSDEVCELLELSQANQRVLLHRARARVRQALEDYFRSADA